MDDKIKVKLAELESLKLEHYVCEDDFYSCPKNLDGCLDENEGHDCNCGAEQHNAKVDAIIKELSKYVLEPRRNNEDSKSVRDALESLCEIRRWMKTLHVNSFDKYYTLLHERFNEAEAVLAANSELDSKRTIKN